MKGEGDTDKHRFIQKRTICSRQTHHIFPLNRWCISCLQTMCLLGKHTIPPPNKQH